ncbi:hypothetical protein [Variovorax paradoxus]|uniref:hypothetical protein n=1 Tax=Variovorax paradoxus TaxID=34073 RepID=UPI003D65185B
MHRLLGRLIHAYARLDHFVGLQIAWLGDYRGQSVKDLLVRGVNFAQRLRSLQLLTLETWGHSDPRVAQEFAAWFRDVRRAQAQRNRLAHGRWGYMRSGAKEIEFVELGWETEATKLKPATKVLMTEFGQLVADVESLQPRFIELQKTFESRTRYTKAWEDANPAALKIWAQQQVELAR